MTPFNWAHRKIEYDAETCARSLDIMRRSCRIGFSYDEPLSSVRRRAWALV